MVRLVPIEDNAQRLVYRIGVASMLCHLSVCTLMIAIIACSLTLVLRHYIGIFAFILIALPGLLIVICGFFGCANARSFLFAFDRSRGVFEASAGGVSLARPLSDIRLVHIEREHGVGGLFGGESPGFAVTLLFSDERRCRLEGGISMTGTGRGPQHMQAAAERIRDFLALPQTNVPVLNIARRSKEESPEEQAQAEGGLARWLSCQGIAPRLEPPLRHYDWAESPAGPVRLPGMNGLLAMRLSQGPVSAGFSLDPGLGPVVMGRPQPQPTLRAIQVTVPEGMAGQTMAVMAPDGTQMSVAVPADMRPGEALTIQY
mmetsp:Transcript_34554/g.96419  ORF Transcript_34554/g.96419 Transcript_34554/m.96419 type:complete len:316 (+) Transcript_34554:31-978(+)